MPGRHHNIFGYYRGPSGRGATEEDRVHRQVEDNTTKALINVLEHSVDHVLVGFLDRFARELAPLTEAGRDRFFLQRGPEGSVHGPRFLLGISPHGEIAPESWTTGVEAASRIDAAIQPGRGGLLVIEVKTASELDGAQLRRHARAWSIEQPAPSDGEAPAGPDAWRLVAWPEVWQWAKDESRRIHDPVSAFLLRQLAEYLGILGLAPWGGFRPEDFQPAAAASHEQRAITKNRLGNLWERVLKKLDAEDRERLGRVEVARLRAGADHYSAETNRGKNCVRFELELYTTELRLNVVASQARPVAWLEGWLTKRERPPVSLEIVVDERAGASSARGAAVARFSVEELLSGAVALWREHRGERGSPTVTPLAYRLHRGWSRAEVLGRGEGIADEVAHDVRALLPLLREINRWD